MKPNQKRCLASNASTTSQKRNRLRTQWPHGALRDAPARRRGPHRGRARGHTTAPPGGSSRNCPDSGLCRLRDGVRSGAHQLRHLHRHAKQYKQVQDRNAPRLFPYLYVGGKALTTQNCIQTHCMPSCQRECMTRNATTTTQKRNRLRSQWPRGALRGAPARRHGPH